MSSKQTYGLIGRQLSHSFSQNLFEERFKSEGYSYRLIELDSIDTLRDTVKRLELDGFNVTIPYKVEILPLLDNFDETARRIGAVNTVKINRNGGKTTLTGYNTDAPAFAATIQNSKFKIQNSKALILGTGGAANAVAYGLESLGIEYLFVSRTPHSSKQIDYETAYTLAPERHVIINATPVGMFPNCSASPWQHPDLLTPRHLCYDLVYNPSPTRFLAEAAAHGATTIDGLQMLHRQAHLSWQLWGLE